jgi:hypothetical protein
MKTIAQRVRWVSAKKPMRSIPNARLRGLTTRGWYSEKLSCGGRLLTDPPVELANEMMDCQM